MKHRLGPVCIIVLATIGGACGASATPPPSPTLRMDPSDPSDPTTASNCNPWECGSNSAWLGENIRFHELDAAGGPNDADLVVGQFFHKSGQPMNLHVDHDELYGEKPVSVLQRLAYLVTGSKPPVWKGKELEGATLQLARLRSPGRWLLNIRKVSHTSFWVGAGRVKGAVPVYELTYYDQLNKTKEAPLCEPPKGGLSSEWQSLEGKALIFRGDRYEALPKLVVEEGGNSSWFNIACAGTTVAKMHLLRHTWASSDETHQTQVKQRQALLKMLTGDYCGGGYSFTVHGQPLQYSYVQDWPPQPPLPSAIGTWLGTMSIDAVWDEKGAVCIDTPRMVANSLGKKAAYLAEIRAKCQALLTPRKIPSCSQLGLTLQGAPSGTMPWIQLGGYAISANPNPTP